MLAVLVDDADAVYPVRIDPTFSDANWFSMGGIPGANNKVYAAVADGSGNLYIGGAFTMVGDLFANSIAKWNGSSWTALGSGVSGIVYALAVSGSDVYAGGAFTIAGGKAANYIARWDGSNWTALGSGMNSFAVKALVVLGIDVYAGGSFTSADGSPANYIARWDGSSWMTLGSGMNREVRALAVSDRNLYAGGLFTTAGGKVSAHVARVNIPPFLSILRSGSDVILSWPSAGTAGFGLEHIPTLPAPVSWLTNTMSIVDDGTNKSATVPATNSQQFFRLRKP